MTPADRAALIAKLEGQPWVHDTLPHILMREAAAALREAERPQVPREPTDAMIGAGYAILGEPDNESPVRNAWRAMYDAAPAQPAPSTAEERAKAAEDNGFPILAASIRLHGQERAQPAPPAEPATDVADLCRRLALPRYISAGERNPFTGTMLLVDPDDGRKAAAALRQLEGEWKMIDPLNPPGSYARAPDVKAMVTGLMRVQDRDVGALCQNAAAMLASLARERDEARDLWNGWARKCADAEAERDALRAENARLKGLP